MLIEGIRFCDVCNEPMELGARYARCVVPNGGLRSIVSSMETRGETPADRVTGDLTIDMCLPCKLELDLPSIIVT